jgi:hypothetical protein
LRQKKAIIAESALGTLNAKVVETPRVSSWTAPSRRTGTRLVFGTGLTPWDDRGCLLSQDGTLIACPSVFVNPQSDPIQYPAQIFRPGGGREPIVDPTNAQFIGWIDDNDIAVATGADGQGLAVENLATGTQTAFSAPIGSALLEWQCDGVIPGAL